MQHITSHSLDALLLYLDKKAKVILGEIEKADTPKTSLLHYTSNYEGLRGILSSRALWLSDYYHLNDNNEIKASLEVTKESIKDFNEKHSLEGQFNDLSEKLEWLIGDRTSRIHLGDVEGAQEQAMYKNIYSTFNENSYIPHTLSFCIHQEHPYAWKHYASTGQGFAIEFRKEFFQPRATLPTPSEPYIMGLRVLYAKEAFRDLVTSFLELGAQYPLNNIEQTKPYIASV